MNTDNLISNIIEGIENVKGVNVNILDLREIENVASQYFIVCTGNSSTQVNAITNSVKKCVSASPSKLHNFSISFTIINILTPGSLTLS